MGIFSMIAVLGLGLIGFSPIGPVAGSLAAGMQAIFYGGSIASGSLFAILQSIAMASPIWFLSFLLNKILNYLPNQYKNDDLFIWLSIKDRNIIS